jgi:transposase-like protein
MMKKTRRRYTVKFKAAAIAWLAEPVEAPSSVAQAVGLAATPVTRERIRTTGLMVTSQFTPSLKI